MVMRIDSDPWCFTGVTIIQGVSIPMSQTSPGYSPPQNKQKGSYQHGSKNEQFPRYPVLCINPMLIGNVCLFWGGEYPGKVCDIGIETPCIVVWRMIP